MDWEALTTDWVEDGLITAEQRGPLLERLQTVQPSVLPVASLMTVLVAPAVWLMVGAVMLLVTTLLDPDSLVLTGIVCASGAATLGAGLMLRFAPSTRPLSRGLLAASIPLGSLGMMALLDEFNLEILLFVVVGTTVAGWVLGVVENSRAVTATAAVSWLAATTMMLMEYEWQGPIATALIVLIGLLALGGMAFAHRHNQHRLVVFQIAAPVVVLLCVGVISLDGGYLGPAFKTLGIPWHWYWEKSLLLLVYGLVVMLFGLYARSGFTLVPAVLCLSGSVIWLSFQLTGYIGGAIALFLVSLALFALAIAMWGYPLVQAGLSRSEASTPEA